MKEKKYILRPQVLIIAGVIVAVLIIAVIAGNIISARNRSKDNTVGMTLTQKILRPQVAGAISNSTEEKEKTTVEILMDDTAVPVGTTFMAAAIVEPEDTDKALVWTSSNQDIMTVDDSGLVTIKGTGTAALTATVGDVSDAVAIEGIESVTSGSKNGYTVYTGNGSITKSSSSGGSRVADSGSNSGSGSTYNDGSASGGSGSTGSSTSDGSIGSNGSSGNSTGSNSGSNSSSGNTSGSMPYIIKEMSPSIQGVVVAARGNITQTKIREISEAVQALFGIEAHKIKVIESMMCVFFILAI